ncbi:MAG: phospholipase C, phosphocholine-specific, partial [Pseudomonas aeruginosa]|nr:phospholipase C, phosphocholine-specific [Pseudomonas aeruginosa]
MTENWKFRRRTFLKHGAQAATLAGLSGLFPETLRRALAVEPDIRTGTIQDVQHVVILMQENRSFDHYFGHLNGVRGFNDPRALKRQDGKPVWYQNYKYEFSPYHWDTKVTSAQWVSSQNHEWSAFHAIWNQGRNYKWMAVQYPEAMGYFKRGDIPYYYALADAFTLCEAYHQSMMGPTNPNRLYHMSGRAAPSGDGKDVHIGNDMGDGTIGASGTVDWTTYPERLQAAGITWRVYQDMADNFSDNPLIGFRQYRAAAPDSPLIVNGLSTWKLDALKRDVLANSLPQVSWIVAPAKYSEHPGPSSPIWGAEYTSWVLDALTANPEVWSKTALLVMFDENDGFFDHVAPPAAPSLNKDGTLRGKTTADATLEWHTKGDIRYRNQPYGLGPRVPMYVISPWSKGGWVNSQVFDHTSVIRFLEQRFGVMEPNISPWRRAVCGDLTSAFNFANPNNEPFPELPDTSQADAIVASQIKLPKPKPPAVAAMPKQEMGIRPARALPYELGVHARYRSGGDALSLTFANTGKAGAVFQVFDLLDSENPPKRYT